MHPGPAAGRLATGEDLMLVAPRLPLLGVLAIAVKLHVAGIIEEDELIHWR